MVIHGCWQNIQIIVLAQIYFLQEDLGNRNQSKRGAEKGREMF